MHPATKRSCLHFYNHLQLHKLFIGKFPSAKPTRNSIVHFSTSSPTKKKQKTQNSQASNVQQFNFKEIDVESLGKCQLQFNSGVGGVEATIFTNDLYEMYMRFAQWNQWTWQPLDVDTIKVDNYINGIRFALVCIEGDCCYTKLRFEGGVHRVQRRPLTDQTRIHTSTVSVAVLPEPEKPEVMFNPGDINMEIMRASGSGGMNVNAKSTAVRATHKPTGIAVKVQDERYLQQNEKLAFQRISAILLKRQVDEINRVYAGDRKLQVGSLERAEKIRTYNYKDNQVIDHRLKHSFNGIESFMEGGEQLEQMVDMLMEMYEQEEAEQSQQSAKKSS